MKGYWSYQAIPKDSDGELGGEDFEFKHHSWSGSQEEGGTVDVGRCLGSSNGLGR